MKQLIKLFSVIIVLSYSGITFGQDSLITSMAKENLTMFIKEGSSFSGPGWNIIIDQTKASNFVLIGEDHFTNEVPYFHAALTSQIKFDNFFCEIDPYLANILEHNIKNFSESELKKFQAEFSNTFAFFALKPEFDLLKQLVESNTRIYGLDQISLMSDRAVCNNLKQTTKDSKAKKIYEAISDSSKIYFDNFLQDHNKPFYLFTNDFQKQLDKLSLLDLSKSEKEIIEALKLSAKIYKEGNHHLRVQLMKNQLLKVNPGWTEQKNLFKFGGIHLAKGESLMKIYDLGNLVNNIADSKYESSLHILILEKSGTQGAPIKGFPEQTIDENSSMLKSLRPFFKAVTGEQWHCFNLIPLREAQEDEKLIVKDITLSRIINGYDLLIIIPVVTAAKLIEII
jgi:hypothetical protein